MTPENLNAGIFEIYTDGASRKNPGPAAFAFIIVQDGTILFEDSEYIGESTNNTAEYQAVIAALKKASEQFRGEIQVFSDSELVIRQITGKYRINQPHLKDLRREVARLEKLFPKIAFRNVPRENRFIGYCDSLCNKTLDSQN